MAAFCRIRNALHKNVSTFTKKESESLGNNFQKIVLQKIHFLVFFNKDMLVYKYTNERHRERLQ